jgi:AraC-like DNA-binding protein
MEYTGHPRPSRRPGVEGYPAFEAASKVLISLAELAALSGVSRFQLLRGFAREVGTTPHAYLIQRRMSLVRHLLATAGLPLMPRF